MMSSISSIKAFISCLFLLLTLSVNAQEKLVTAEMPEGFDDLLEPQLTVVDIYYNGSAIGSAMATYTPDAITFENPENILVLLKNIKTPDKILSELSMTLNANQSLVCFYQGQPDCGVLYPEVLGVIFDESRLKVDLFIHSDYLETQNLVLDKYLPPSTSGSSMISSLSVVTSGGEGQENIYTAQLNNIISYDNYRLLANIESDEINNTRLDQFSLVYEYRDLNYQLGSFRTLTQSSGFFEQRDFLGFRVSSSLTSRTDLEQISGTKIYVFLNERSRVEVYKDGQLIDTVSYQPGNIELDTRNFPQGAYNVELRVIGDSGRERRETYFYSKSLSLPPINETLFFVEAGFPEDDRTRSYPVAKADPLARLGIVSRYSDHLGLNASLSGNSEQEALEIGSSWMFNQIDFQTSHAINSDSEHASYYLLNFHHKHLFLSASYRRSYSDNRNNLSTLDPDLNLIPSDSRQTLINLGIPFSDAILNIFARTSEREIVGFGTVFPDLENNNKTRVLGLSFRKNLFRSGNMLIDWTLDASKDDNEKRLFTGLSFRFLNNHYNFESRLSRQIRDSERQSVEDSSLREKSNQQHWDKNIRLSYRNSAPGFGTMSHSLEYNKTLEQTTSALQSEINSDYGYGRLSLQNIRDPLDSNVRDSRNNYSLTGRVNLVTTGEDFAWGGSRQNTAGVMINLESIKADNLFFAIIINGVERTRVKAGEQSFVTLPPYETYELSLLPKGDVLVDFDDVPKKFTLYPGNVETFSWEVKEVKVVVLQLVALNGYAFTNAKLKDIHHYARSDDMGWLQMEISQPGEFIFINGKDEECRVEITSKDLQKRVNYLGAKSCLE